MCMRNMVIDESRGKYAGGGRESEWRTLASLLRDHTGKLSMNGLKVHRMATGESKIRWSVHVARLLTVSGCRVSSSGSR